MKNEQDIDKIIEEGKALLEGKKYHEAIEKFEQIIAIDNSIIEAYKDLGNAYLDLKEYDKAVENYQKAIALDPKFARAYNGLGNVYYDIKDYDKAVEYYQKAIDLDPNYAMAYNNLGVVYDLLKNYGQAKEYYQKAIDLDSNFVGSYYNLGLMYHGLKDYDKAVEYYQKAIDSDKKFALAYNNLGNVYYLLKDYEKAKENHQKAIDLDPNSAMAYLNLANSYYFLKDYKQTKINYRKAITLDATYPNPWAGLARLNKKMGKLEKATQQLIRYEYLTRKSNKDISSSLNYILEHFKEFYHPFFLQRMFANYPVITELYLWQDLVHEVNRQCSHVLPFLKYLQNTITSENAQYVHKLRGVIHFYMGDPATAFAILNEEETQEVGEDLQWQYYLKLSADAFLEEQQSKDVLAGALQVCDAVRANLTKQTELNGKEIIQVYYAGLLYTLIARNYQAAIECLQHIREFPPALYLLMYCYERTHQKQAKDQAIERILLLEENQQGLLSFMEPQQIDLEQEEYAAYFLRLAYAQEVIETFELITEYLEEKHSFLQSYKQFLQTHPHDIWQLSEQSIKIIKDYEKEATQTVIKHLKEKLVNHSEKLNQWQRSGYPPHLEMEVGKLITDSYDDNLIDTSLNTSLLNLLYLEDRLPLYAKLWLEVWNQIVKIKRQKFTPFTEDSLKILITSVLSFAVQNAYASGGENENSSGFVVLTTATVFSSLAVKFLSHRLWQHKVKDIKASTYEAFKSEFITFVREMKEEIGEEKFNKDYPLAGFETWANGDV